MSAPLGGPYRYTREGRGVFHFPLARPWTWAITHLGMWSVFVTDEEPPRQGVPARRYPRHPPPELMGQWLAIYATRDYDADAVSWLRAAHAVEAPAGDVLPHGAYVAVARLAEVSTVGNDYRAFGRDPWWAPRGASCRGTIAWWLEEIQPLEPLPAAHAQRLAPVDVALLPELRERMGLARDRLWRPEVYAVPASLPSPPPAPVAAPAPARTPAPASPPPPPPPRAVDDDRPVPPMLAEPEQLGLFGEAPQRTLSPATAPLLVAPDPPASVPEAATHLDVMDTLHQLQTHCRTPPAVLMEGARRVRELLSDGKPHEWREVWAVATVDPAQGSLANRVTESLEIPGPLLPWRVRTTSTCKGDGYSWHTLAEGATC